ncbi:MAG TPA: ABC transporter permease [Thermoanaerobaculia bacterium]|nr:ABC transporter permease [Thermoanaerobaculia bacterium]
MKRSPVSSAELARAFEAARDAIRTDVTRTRAALVALAIAMAIVVCLTALVERGRAATIRALERAGLNNLYLINRSSVGAGEPGISRLTAADAERLRRLTRARSTLVVRMDRRSITVRGAPSTVAVYAVSGPVTKLFGMRARSGRLLLDLDVHRKSPYAVLGSQLSRQIPNAYPGSILTVGGRGYEIVGQLAECETESASAGEIPSLDWNRAIVLPLGAEPGSAEESDARYPIDVAVLSFSSASEADDARRFALSLDPARYRNGPVRLASPYQTLRQYKQTRRTFDRLIWLVALMTGASAVFGISNLLSASVIARTREIGVRRAVGARTKDIVLQFQAEGILLGVLGGGAGLIVGIVVSLLSMDRSADGSSLSLFSFSVLAVSCVAVGILTGIRPSQRAARIDPAAALRDG